MAVPNSVSNKATLSRNWDDTKVRTNPYRNLYFGDLHVHTAFSADAYLGGTIASPDDAYRFAKGEEIVIFGKKVKLRKPLDFAAVTDHSEMLGEMYSLLNPEAPKHNNLILRYLRSIRDEDSSTGIDTSRQRKIFRTVLKLVGKGKREHPGFFAGYETTKTAWSIILQAAEKHYVPGTFTTFAGYEWTLTGLQMNHLHRNIIFRDMVVPDFPLSSLELKNEEELWKWLELIAAQGATAMAIPHNTNLSDGGTFTDSDPRGNPLTPQYARLRQNNEPLLEIHQVKGSSEVHPAFWKNDEFAAFENHWMFMPREKNYARYALKKGLEYEANIGVNPFKYGFIGSTDTHNGTPGNSEEDDEYIGNKTILDFFPEGRRFEDWILEEKQKVYEALNPGGLVAVWAEANTRAHIYDALKRKETYATSGNRIQLRFFAGYGFSEKYDSYETMLADGYSKGVPMGGDIAVMQGAAPQFIVWAMKDPDGANLDRIQIIKGWYAEGKSYEKIFNCALSDGRTVAADGSVPDNGATVNHQTGQWSKDKGNAELMAVWQDPEFNPLVPAFYYARVLEVPTASWRLWDKIRYGIDYPSDAEMVIRERAWSSPVWYTPPKQ
ncbi:MAG: hypothetical protein KatS3mg031_1727 [Chitinophagales bacterium]|nr:MAG: hypothetical protein KatS3mg031_1727 [Chitinophagales bacterium]